MKSNKLEEYQQELVSSVIETMKDDPSFIQRWANIPFEPVNGATNHTYQGVNNINLTMRLGNEHADDPRFYTFKQIQDMDLKLEKGAKSSKVLFFTMREKEIEKDNGDKETVNIPLAKLSYAFPAKYVQGLEPYEKTDGLNDLKQNMDLYSKMNHVIENAGVEISHGGNKAYYSPSDDIVKMPPPERFSSKEAYASTLLHELAHSTGHKNRQDRDLSGEFGTESYAKEELRAELSSVFMSQKLGIKYTIENDQSHLENSSAYIKEWVKVLENEPKELFRAAQDASKITKELINEQELEKTHIKIIASDNHAQNLFTKVLNNHYKGGEFHILTDRFDGGEHHNIDKGLAEVQKTLKDGIKDHYGKDGETFLKDVELAISARENNKIQEKNIATDMGIEK